MDPLVLSFVSACTALVASLVGPFVTLTVARRQIHASVVSANREKWIESLRNELAELIALIASAVVVRSKWREKWQGGFGPAVEDLGFLEKVQRAVLAQTRIRLMLNPSEADNRQLCDAIEKALAHIRSHETPDAETEADVLLITVLAQGILKREWERVKTGT